MNYEEIILNVMSKNCDTITIEEFKKLNIPNVYLTRMINKGLIERIKKGLYVIKNT